MAAALVADPRLGTELAGYRIEAVLGEGGMGVVYLARDPWLDRRVALKLVAPRLASEPVFRERFLRESRLAASLEHAHVIPIYEAGEAGDVLYLAMRYVEGTDLAGLLESGPLEPSSALAILERVAVALDAAHAKGLVHRDVKPGNVLLADPDADGAIAAVYLSDFGLTRHVDSGNELSEPQHILGTLHYLAPEQIEGGVVGPPADVYSLGCVLYECLTGQVPFAGVTKMQLLWRHLEHPPPRPSEAAPGLALAFDGVIARALAKEPEQRFETCGELVAAASLAIAGELDASKLAAQTRAALEPLESRNPYKGLRAFGESDADDFFGRSELVAEILARLESDPLVAVVGPSGSGKSSVVRAGVLPSLRQGAINGSDNWLIAELVPGADPIRELEASLRRLPPARHFDPGEALAEGGLAQAARRLADGAAGRDLLLFIDQFEELFTLASERQRSAFVELLADAVTHSHGRPKVRVVLTLRADFYDRPLRVRALSQLIEEGTVVVHPLSPEQLEEAIVAPARGVGAQLESGLLADIVADVLDQPGALPLLQHALAELYDRAADGTMTVEDYRQIGGVAGALSLRAEELHASLSVAEQYAARRLFTRLVALGEGTEDTRRRILRAEVASMENDTPAVEAVVDTYGRHRLLSFDRDTVTNGPTLELAHEALVREWPRLRMWIDEDRDGLRLLRGLGESAVAWDASGRDPGDLYRGARLEQACSWHETHPDDLNPLEVEFLDESCRLRDDEARIERDRVAQRLRQNRRLRIALTVVAIALVGAIIAGVLAFSQSRRADREAAEATDARATAETRRLASDAAQLVETDRRAALLLAAEAFNREPGPVSLGALQRVLTSTGSFLGYLGGDREWRDVAFVDDTTVAAVSARGLSVFDIDELRELLSVPTTDPSVLEISQDGTVAAVAAGSTVLLVDLLSGSVRGEPLEHPSKVLSMAFSPDAERLATGDLDGAVRFWDVREGSVERELAAHPERSLSELEGAPEGATLGVFHQPESLRVGVTSIAFSPDGRQLITGGLVVVRLWDADSGIRSNEFLVDRPADREGPRALTSPIAADMQAERPDVVRVGTAFGILNLDAQTGERVDEIINQARLDPGATVGIEPAVALGREAAIIGTHPDRLVSVISESGRTSFETLLSGRPSVALSDDGRTAAIAASGGILLWALDGRRLVARAVPIDGEGAGPQLSADGSKLASGDGVALEVWDISAREPRRTEPLFEEVPAGIFWVRNIVTSSEQDQEVIGRDPDTLAATGVSYGRFSSALAQDVSSDRSLIAIGTGGPRPQDDSPVIRVMEFDTGEIVAELDDLVPLAGEEAIVSAVAFNADGRRLAASTGTGAALVWSTSTWEPVGPELSAGNGAVVGVTYSPDGRWLVTVAADGTLTLRDPETYQPARPPLVGATSGYDGGDVGTAYFSTDGRLMVTVVGGDAALWDLESGQQIGRSFSSGPDSGADASADGRVLATVESGAILLWDLAPDTWPQIACQAAGRNLTLAEWEEFGPTGEPYRATCPQWPAAGETSPTQ